MFFWSVFYLCFFGMLLQCGKIYISGEKREVNDVKGFYLILYSLALDIYYFFWQ